MEKFQSPSRPPRSPTEPSGRLPHSTQPRGGLVGIVPRFGSSTSCALTPSWHNMQCDEPLPGGGSRPSPVQLPGSPCLRALNLPAGSTCQTPGPAGLEILRTRTRRLM
jgi:hypothetical protein